MIALPDYKTITNLIKKGMTLEAQEQIMVLREAAIDLKAENTALRERLSELQKKLDLKDHVKWEAPYYFLRNADKKDGPFCQHCYDKDKQLIRLQSWGKGAWKCLSCKNTVVDKDYTPPKPVVRRSTYLET